MKILGIDYGQRKIGLAIAETKLAEPHSVIRYGGDEIFGKIAKIIGNEGVELVVVGLSEGLSAERTRTFADKLKLYTKVPIEFSDETLSTQTSLELMLKAGKKRKKRKEMEDAYAATLILQSYLDEL